MATDLGRMLQTYTSAQLQYRSTGNTQFKPAADAAKTAIEKYIRDLSRSVEDRERKFRNYANSRTGTGSEVNELAQETRVIREKSNTIAADYLIAQSTNQPTPIEWSNYYIKFSVIAGLVGAILVTAFVDE